MLYLIKNGLALYSYSRLVVFVPHSLSPPTQAATFSQASFILSSAAVNSGEEG